MIYIETIVMGSLKVPFAGQGIIMEPFPFLGSIVNTNFGEIRVEGCYYNLPYIP